MVILFKIYLQSWVVKRFTENNSFCCNFNHTFDAYMFPKFSKYYYSKDPDQLLGEIGSAGGTPTSTANIGVYDNR